MRRIASRLIGMQLPLFGGAPVPVWSSGHEPPQPRARRKDPVTSKDAAIKAEALADKHRLMIVECLKVNGKASKDAIAARTKLTGVQVGRRLKELQASGSIRLTGSQVMSTSGRMEREWEAA